MEIRARAREIPRNACRVLSQARALSPAQRRARALGLHPSPVMKSFNIAFAVVVALVIGASPASAQRRTAAARRAPAPGMIGVGASIGADIPQDDNLDK